MALAAKVKKENYSYETYVDRIDSKAIKAAKNSFSDFREQGIILNDSFDDRIWLITDEAEKCSINFGISEITFESNCRYRLGCTFKQYSISMRVLVTMLFGSDIRALQKLSVNLRKLVGVVSGDIDIKTIQGNIEILIDFLDLLPGETFYKDELRDALSDMNEYIKASYLAKNSPRELSTYQSYFRFFECINNFWKQASEEDRLFYFPVYLWWNLTAILPLRPSEFVLIPRNCLVKDGERTRMTIRRTKIKGQKLKAEYRIDKDYGLHYYDIPDNLAEEIQGYIKGTSMYDHSDIGTLLCCQYQYNYLNFVRANNSVHYTYCNLRDCLRYFYNLILRDEMGLFIREKSGGFSQRELADDEIEWITLGDTRHLAMINLIVSGGNPLICKELAGHEDINISANYYANIKNFVEVLSFAQYRKTKENSIIEHNPRMVSTQNMPVLLNNARCSSEKIMQGDYSDCLTAISSSGKLLDCHSCKYYTLPKKAIKTDLRSIIAATHTKEADMQETFDFLLYAIERVRKGFDYQESLQSALLRHQAAALQYKNALVRKYEMEGL